MVFIYRGRKTEITSKELILTKEGINLYQVMLKIHSENGWPVSKAGYAYLDDKGNFLIKGIFDGASAFKNGLAVVNRNGKMGVINKQGENILPIAYDVITTLSPEEYKRVNLKATLQGQAIVGKLALIATTKMEIPSNGKLIVKQGREWKEVSVAHAMDFSADKQA